MESKTDTHEIKIEQKTEYPKNGRITIKCDADKRYIAFRIPGWCKSFTVNCGYVMKNGYAYVALNGKDDIEIELDIPVRLIAANRRIHSDAGRVAVVHGPVVYCAEGADNGADLKSVLLDIKGEFEIKETNFYFPCLKQRLTAPRKPKAFTMKRTTIMRKYRSRLFRITLLQTAARPK